MTRRALLAVSLALAACHDLPPIDPGVCGNRVIDVGEDCDAGTPTPECIACRFACSTADIVAGAPSTCPAGFTCGADDTCSAPSGRLRPGQVTAALGDADPVAIGDVDGDLIGDIVGARSRVREYVIQTGTATGDLSAPPTRRRMQSSGRPVFDHVDDRGLPYATLDAVLPMAGGVVTQVGSPGGWAQYPHALAEVPFEDDTGVGAAALYSVLEVPVGAVMVGKAFDTWSVVYLEQPTRPLCGVAGLTTGDLIGDLAVGRPTFATADWYAVAHTDVQCVYAFDGTINDWAPVPVSLGSGLTLLDEGTPVFADAFPADNCPDLYLPINDGGARGTAVVRFVSGGGFGCQPSGPAVVAFPGSTALVLAAVDMDGDNTDELITDGGIPLVGYLPRTWTHAATVDINNDGLVDVVGFVAGEYGVDLLLTSTRPFGLFVTQFRIDTHGAVASIDTGDFDGDGFGDVVVFDNLAELGPEVDTQWVAYGQAAGGPTPVVFTGAFTSVRASARVDLGLPDEGLDGASDLVVVNRDPAGPESSTYLSIGFGRADRSLLTPYVILDGMQRNATLFTGQLDGADGIDVAGWYVDDLSSDTPEPTPTASRWYATANAYGHLATHAENEFPIAARYAVLRRTGRDIVVAIEPSPSQRNVIEAFVVGQPSNPVTLQTAIAGEAVVDVDDDGASDLVVVGDTAAVVRVSDGLVVDVAPLDDPRLAGCTGAAAIDLGDTAGGETPVIASVVAWCDNTLRAIQFTGADAYAVRDLAFEVKPGDLAVGDVDGDRVDDIVVHDPTTGTTMVYRQCASRDTSDCEREID